MLFVAILLGLLALFLFWQASRQRSATGLPAGRVIYDDGKTWGPVEKPLYDVKTGLTGKPDYLVETSAGRMVPVEVKTGRTPDTPHDSHIFQLAAYCYLVEQNMGTRPPYGILRYPQRTFAIDYTPELENALKDTLAEMRLQERRGEADRSHELPARCTRCGYRSICDQRLE